jgi:Flp pilus assembly protein TadG
MLPQRNKGTKRRSRAGGVFTLELLLVLPIVLAVCLGLVELSLLLMSMQRVQSASSAACRVGTLPANDPAAQRQAMEEVAAKALGTVGMASSYQMQSQIGQYAGDPVIVEVTVPMTAAAPDLLRTFGFSLRGRVLTAHTQMCKQ